jgi:hypothetical protein
MKKLMAFLRAKMIEKSIGEQTKIQILTGKEIRELRRRGAHDFDQFVDDVLEDRSDSEKALMWLKYVGIPDHNKLINEIGR